MSLRMMLEDPFVDYNEDVKLFQHNNSLKKAATSSTMDVPLWEYIKTIPRENKDILPKPLKVRKQLSKSSLQATPMSSYRDGMQPNVSATNSSDHHANRKASLAYPQSKDTTSRPGFGSRRCNLLAMDEVAMHNRLDKVRGNKPKVDKASMIGPETRGNCDDHDSQPTKHQHRHHLTRSNFDSHKNEQGTEWTPLEESILRLLEPSPANTRAIPKGIRDQAHFLEVEPPTVRPSTQSTRDGVSVRIPHRTSSLSSKSEGSLTEVEDSTNSEEQFIPKVRNQAPSIQRRQEIRSRKPEAPKADYSLPVLDQLTLRARLAELEAEVKELREFIYVKIEGYTCNKPAKGTRTWLERLRWVDKTDTVRRRGVLNQEFSGAVDYSEWRKDPQGYLGISTSKEKRQRAASDPAHRLVKRLWGQDPDSDGHQKKKRSFSVPMFAQKKERPVREYGQPFEPVCDQSSKRSRKVSFKF